MNSVLLDFSQCTEEKLQNLGTCKFETIDKTLLKELGWDEKKGICKFYKGHNVRFIASFT